MSDALLKGPGLFFITLVAVSALSSSCSSFTLQKKHCKINCLKDLFNCTGRAIWTDATSAKSWQKYFCPSCKEGKAVRLRRAILNSQASIYPQAAVTNFPLDSSGLFQLQETAKATNHHQVSHTTTTKHEEPMLLKKILNYFIFVQTGLKKM